MTSTPASACWVVRWDEGIEAPPADARPTKRPAPFALFAELEIANRDKGLPRTATACGGSAIGAISCRRDLTDIVGTRMGIT